MGQDIVRIEVEMRECSGTGSARALRRKGVIPAVAYGKGRPSIKLTLSSNEFTHKYKSENLLTHLIQIDIDNKPELVLLREVQRDYLRNSVKHVDFQFVDRNKEIKVEAPLNILNEHSCKGIKQGGVLNVLHSALPVRCLPDRIPQTIDIDIEHLSIGDSIHVNDLLLPENVSIHFKEGNAAIITISSSDTGSFVKEENNDEESSSK